jgi:two-component system phosphate regulon response regulator PhoB
VEGEMMRKTVLLVDDDPIFRDSIAIVLGTRYEIVAAGNGAEAAARVAELHPDLIILDVMMDHLSEGFDVARRLRKDPATATIPIMMLTGVDRVYNVRMEVDETWVPADRYLEKPVSPQQILQEVEDLIGK